MHRSRCVLLVLMFTLALAGAGYSTHNVTGLVITPSEATLNSPLNASDGHDFTVELNVTVFQGNNESVLVEFYGDGGLIDSVNVTGTIGGAVATAEWSNLTSSKYVWWVETSDSLSNVTTVSSEWSFFTHQPAGVGGGGEDTDYVATGLFRVTPSRVVDGVEVPEVMWLQESCKRYTVEVGDIDGFIDVAISASGENVVAGDEVLDSSDWISLVGGGVFELDSQEHHSFRVCVDVPEGVGGVEGRVGVVSVATGGMSEEIELMASGVPIASVFGARVSGVLGAAGDLGPQFLVFLALLLFCLVAVVVIARH